VPATPPQPPGAEDIAAGGVVARTRLSVRRLSPSTEPLFRSAYALILSTLATGVLGIAHCVLAARSYPPRALGEASSGESTLGAELRARLPLPSELVDMGLWKLDEPAGAQGLAAALRSSAALRRPIGRLNPGKVAVAPRTQPLGS